MLYRLLRQSSRDFVANTVHISVPFHRAENHLSRGAIAVSKKNPANQAQNLLATEILGFHSLTARSDVAAGTDSRVDELIVSGP